MGEGLLRQRRNLMIASILLWIMKYGGVNFSKISIVGFDLEFKNPNALILSLWIAFGYFLFRYYQYFSDEGVKKLQSVFNEAYESKCKPIIRTLVEENYPTNTHKNYSYFILKSNSWIYKGAILNEGGRDTTPFEFPIERWQLWKGIMSAIMDSIFRNSVVTDYILPLLIACTVLYYCGVDDWKGSFLNIF